MDNGIKTRKDTENLIAVGNDGTVSTAAIMGQPGNTCGATPGPILKSVDP